MATHYGKIRVRRVWSSENEVPACAMTCGRKQRDSRTGTFCTKKKVKMYPPPPCDYLAQGEKRFLVVKFISSANGRVTGLHLSLAAIIKR